MTPAVISNVANHLWQSSLVLAVVWALAWALRRNRAEARYRLWLAASIKFLIPFAAFVEVGHRIGWPTVTVLPQPAMSAVLESIHHPFVAEPSLAWMQPAPVAAVHSAIPRWPMALVAIWLCGSVAHLVAWTIRWRRVAALVKRGERLDDLRLVARLRHVEARSGIRRPIRAVVSDAEIEPGIFGIARPILVWPRGIDSRLTNEQADAVLTHEIAHVRRHDNLAAAMHMVVEAVFWFFPPVWWLERRLVAERERACDQTVLRLGSDPQRYAEGILRTCEFYAELPLVCVSGVTGSDLKQRIIAIMKGHGGEALSVGRRLLLGATAVAAIALPITLGVLQTPMLRAQVPAVAKLPSFEVASIKANQSGQQGASFGPRGSQLVVVNNTLFNIIRNAYGIQGNQILGGPDWIRDDRERWDITAKAPEGTKPDQLLLMVQQLIADRFKVRLHKETQEVPMFALVMARADRRLGPQMKPAAFDCNALRAAIARGEKPTPPPQTDRPACGAQTRPGQFLVGGYPVSDIARNLSSFVGGRPIVDRTGLTGIYDLQLTWTPEQPPIAPPGQVLPPLDPNGPSIFTAVEEQLGLRLQATTGPVEVLVIDSAERPTPD
jgi:bla regulator protein blaR1